MKTKIIIAVGTISLFLAGCGKPTTVDADSPRTLVLGAESDSDSESFGYAFEMESACHGLTLVPDFKFKGKQPHWLVSFESTPNAFLYMSAIGFENPGAVIEVKDAGDAARTACIIASGKGGTVR